MYQKEPSNNSFFLYLIDLHKIINELEIEYDKVLELYYRNGGTKEFLENSGVKKTFIKGKK